MTLKQKEKTGVFGLLVVWASNIKIHTYSPVWFCSVVRASVRRLKGSGFDFWSSVCT